MIDNSPEPLKRPAEPALVRPAEVVFRNPEPPPEMAPPEAGNGLVEYWRVLLRHKGTVLLLVIVGSLAGYLLTVSDTPIYRAHTTVEVQGLNENFLNMKDLNPTSSGYSIDPAADILTQVKLLESRSLRERTVAKLQKQGVTAAAP